MITIINNDLNSEWRNRFAFVDSIEVITNNSNEVELGVSKASIIGFYFDISNTNNNPVTIEFAYGINGQYFPYCIIDRKQNKDIILDQPKKLVVTFPGDGQYSYAMDRFITTDTLKIIQTSNDDANIKAIVITDSIW